MRKKIGFILLAVPMKAGLNPGPRTVKN